MAIHTQNLQEFATHFKPTISKCLFSAVVWHTIDNMPTLKTYTLGCKVNQYETEYLREGLLRLGYTDAAEDEPGDCVIVNTCTVTAQSDFKSRKILRRVVRENPDAEIVVTGCYATRKPHEIRMLFEREASLEIIGDKRDIPAFLRRHGLAEPPGGIAFFGERHRAYVKVQDGCRVGCAYCIIPKVRPYLLSRPAEPVLEEIRALAGNGYAEIVLTGIHLGHYGIDLSAKSNLATLLGQIVALIDRESLPLRLRLSSLEAVEVSDELIRLFRDHPKVICPHFHLSMQSGSDEVLRNMRRRWLSGPFLEKCELLRRKLDGVALTTDVIVGFPGETDAQFQETCDMVRRIGFSKVHVFRFSGREGTEAVQLPNQIPSGVKKERAAVLQRLADQLRNDYAESLLGMTVQTLLEEFFNEQENTTVLSGTADRYLKVKVPGDAGWLGKLVDVRLEEAHGEDLMGTIR